MKNGQKPSLVCIFLKHGKFWSVSQGYFIKHKLLISEYQLNYFSIVSPLYHVRSLCWKQLSNVNEMFCEAIRKFMIHIMNKMNTSARL